jgi:hypothetical protein
MEPACPQAGKRAISPGAKKDCFGETPKPTRETRALPRPYMNAYFLPRFFALAGFGRFDAAAEAFRLAPALPLVS